ncbi:hypothetical protein [Planotetraspora silvatica]|uniref:hypothetical protein n=1 Tax=Planotetraspora silvatica TaxID=234614 RepID=UPI0019517A04|nr:hypothetical protein [Planotetraspora silvatica]
MSSTGVWIVGVIPGDEAVLLSEQFASAAGRRPAIPGHADDRGVPCTSQPGHPTSAAGRLVDLILSHGPILDTTRDAIMALYPAEEGPGLYVTAVRKVRPAVALRYGLGAEEISSSSGWFGDFLLTSEEVRQVLPLAEAALAITGPRRASVLARIDEWMSGLGESPDFDVAELLDRPLGVLRHASENGAGAAGLTAWY